jgi:hypothetical protein
MARLAALERLLVIADLKLQLAELHDRIEKSTLPGVGDARRAIPSRPLPGIAMSSSNDPCRGQLPASSRPAAIGEQAFEACHIRRDRAGLLRNRLAVADDCTLTQEAAKPVRSWRRF